METGDIKIRTFGELKIGDIFHLRDNDRRYTFIKMKICGNHSYNARNIHEKSWIKSYTRINQNSRAGLNPSLMN